MCSTGKHLHFLRNPLCANLQRRSAAQACADPFPGMQKWLRCEVAQASRAPPVTPRETVQQTMLERVVIFRTGAIFNHSEAESTMFQEPWQSLPRVMKEMVRQGESEPIFAEMARLIAAKIGQPDQDDAAGAQEPAGFLQDGAWIGQMLKRIPKRDDVEF